MYLLLEAAKAQSNNVQLYTVIIMQLCLNHEGGLCLPAFSAMGVLHAATSGQAHRGRHVTRGSSSSAALRLVQHRLRHVEERKAPER